MMISIDPLFEIEEINIALAWFEADVTIRPSGNGLLREMQAVVADVRAAQDKSEQAQSIEIRAARQAYKKLGKDPSRYRPAAEALHRRVLQGKELFQINNITDINNLISLRTGISIGTYDRRVLQPPLILTKATESDSYEGIGRGPLNLTNLPVLKDSKGAFGSPTSDSTRSMIRDQTTNILMIFYLFGETRPDGKELENLLRAHADARLIKSGMNGS